MSDPRWLLRLLIVCGALCFTTPAQAAYMTGKVLLGLCTSQQTDNQFACENYIAGVVDYHILLRSLGTAPSVDFCVPKAIKMQQVKQAVVNHLAARPEQQSFVAAPAVALALYGAFPCSRQKK